MIKSRTSRFRNKYRLELRENDHEPMHVHFVGGDINAKIDLSDLKIVAGTIPANLKKEVLTWLKENQANMIEEWKNVNNNETPTTFSR